MPYLPIVCHLAYTVRVSSQQTRVDFRVPADIKDKFQEAALYENGGDLSAFLIAAGVERADKVLAAHDALVLDDTNTRARFYAALRDTSAPSDTLQRLVTQVDPRVRLTD